jgi:MFS family permease
MSLSVFIVFVGGILGNELADSKSLSTLPVAAIVVGTAVSIFPVIRLMSVFGRKTVFLMICIYSIALLGLSAFAIITSSFLIFCLSSFLLGATVATMNQFRFAAIESVSEEQRATATAIVLLGGLVSAYLGPEVATIGKEYLPSTLLVHTYYLDCFF